MTEIVQGGQTFEIKGDQPTAQEQVAIDSFLKARNLDDEKTGLEDIDEGRVFITPEEVLSEAERGKYNKDTESFLASPSFKRIITEVGLSIAGGIAGFAAAPFTGGSSLIGTAAMAARIARIARPLLNVSARQVAKMGSGVVAASVGGGSGAAIAQTFDPKEDIVKEVARGAFQGGFGEVLGFGMAGALGKVYNKVAGQKIQMIKGGRMAAQNISRQKAYYKLLDQARKGAPISDDLIAKTQAELGKKLSDEQLKVLKDPKIAKERADYLMTERGDDFFKRVDRGTLTPALITENSMVDTLENILGASFFGGGRMLSAAQGARLGLLGGMDEFVETVIKGTDKGVINPNALETLISKSVENSQLVYNRTLTQGYKSIAPLIAEATEQTVNGKIIPKLGYGVDLSWDGVRKNYVFNTTTRQTEDSMSLAGILKSERAKLDKIRQKGATKEALDLVDEFSGLAKPSATFNEVLSEYRTLSQRLTSGGNSPLFQNTGRAIQKLLKAELDRMPLPQGIRAEYNKLANLTKMGPDMFNNGIFHRIAKTGVGQKKILDQILVKGKNDVAEDFLKKLDMTDTGIVAGKKGAGARLLPVEDSDKIKDGIRAQFIKKFIDDSTELKDQYIYLRADKARNFVERDFKEFIEKGGLLTKGQVGHLKEFVNALKFADGAITAPGAKANRGTIFIQLKEMGALTQLGTVALAGQGYIDPGSALAFVLAPAALSKLFTNPRLMKFLIDGTEGAQARNFNQFSRFMGQFGSALVSEGLIDEEQNSMVQANIKTNQNNFDKIFKNELPDNTFFTTEETYNPTKEDPIAVDLNQPQATNVAATSPRNTSNIPLPNVTPSNLPMGGQSNTELAQALNLFNKGGIVSAKKNF
jgi:hypothetical protein